LSSEVDECKPLMSGHDAEVCADRPAPRLRLSIDVDASNASLLVGQHRLTTG